MFLNGLMTVRNTVIYSMSLLKSTRYPISEVSQSSITGPLFFYLTSNDASDKIILFADDTSLIISRHNTEVLAVCLKRGLKNGLKYVHT